MVTTSAANRFFAEVEKRLGKHADPVSRAQVINEEIESVAEVLALLGRRRRSLITGLRREMSAQQIADALNISRARVYALLAESARD